MEAFKVIEIKKSVFEGNDRHAASLREKLRGAGLFMLNLMSSPGSGKTTTILRTIEALRGELALGVMEADIDSDVDAATVARTGTRVIQVHSGGMCHLDATMAREGLEELGTEGLDLVILENIGNLICTAEFDTGASANAMILSVPEGDDKPLKYPGMFSMVDVVLVNKMDAMPVFDFDMVAFRERVARLNPRARVIPVSAKTGEGIGEWAAWLRDRVQAWRESPGQGRGAINS